MHFQTMVKSQALCRGKFRSHRKLFCFRIQLNQDLIQNPFLVEQELNFYMIKILFSYPKQK